MKNNFSRRAKAILSLALIVTCANPICISAKNGDINGLSDEGEVYIQSEEYQKRIEKKTEWVDQQSKLNVFRSAGRLGVSHYTQEQPTWCGPASMQMVVHYVTGRVYPQSTLARDLQTGLHGTYVDIFATQLVAYTGLAYELGQTSNGNFYNNVKADFDANYPVVYDVDVSVLDQSYSKPAPHYVVGEGYATNGNLYYNDPFKSNGYSGIATQAKMIEALNGNGGYYIY